MADSIALNKILSGYGVLLGAWSSAPELVSVGAFSPNQAQEEICIKTREKLSYSERQIIAAPNAQVMPGNRIPYLETEFAMIHGRRQLGEKVPSLTVGTLLCCPETLELYVQKRSMNTATYPGRFSMFGGHICLDQKDLGYGMVLDCMIREVEEEAKISLLKMIPEFPSGFPTAVVLEESETGSLQYTPLCLAINKSWAEHLDGGQEGSVVRLHLERDAELIMKADQWSHMGYCTIASWVYRGLAVQSSYGEAFPQKVIDRLQSYLFA